MVRKGNKRRTRNGILKKEGRKAGEMVAWGRPKVNTGHFD